tara:strand:- start:1882 stop:2505 length:624 start_codon:yes stop_codon:yes gene_type:complete
MIEQGTPEWFEQRRGKATASKIHDIISKTRSGTYSAGRKNYFAQLVLERLTGNVEETFSNAAMQWGTDKEPIARVAYEFTHNVEVDQVSFVDHPTIAMCGASPDGLVGEDGLVEIKCPNSATHLDTLRGSKIDAKYMTQMQWQMACTGRKWCDFVSFDPRFPEHLQMHVRRVVRDDERIEELEKEVAAFLDEVSAELQSLQPVAEAA